MGSVRLLPPDFPFPILVNPSQILMLKTLSWSFYFPSLLSIYKYLPTWKQSFAFGLGRGSDFAAL